MKIIEFPQFGVEEGELIPVELAECIPFVVQRVYFLRNVPADVVRGEHAHLIEREVFVCLQGQCTAKIDTDGQGKKEVILDNPTKAILVDTMEWHEFANFSSDCLLMAFSSTEYLPGEQNYLNSYTEFQKIKNNE